jgi:hypothetical protein
VEIKTITPRSKAREYGPRAAAHLVFPHWPTSCSVIYEQL